MLSSLFPRTWGRCPAEAEAHASGIRWCRGAATTWRATARPTDSTEQPGLLCQNCQQSSLFRQAA